jgi:hypothetical protein
MTGKFCLIIKRLYRSFPRREYIVQEDLTKAARKVSDAKKHESEFNFFIIQGIFLNIFYSQAGVFCIDPHVIYRLHYIHYSLSRI